jgi:DNA-binding winged helix-turn-helix (wHTH) protein
MGEHEKRQNEPIVSFGPYRLDLGNVQLWRGVQEVKITGKAFAVLRYFVEHPGQLATKDDLFAAAWPETVVSEATLVSGIQELRQALRDDAKKPRYIETVHRRGYRFISEVASRQQPGASRQDNQKPVGSPSTSLRINSVEGTNDKNTGQAEGLRLEAAELPLFSPSSLEPTAFSLAQDSAPNPQHSPAARFSRGLLLAAVLLILITAVTVHYLSLPVPSTQPPISNP